MPPVYGNSFDTNISLAVLFVHFNIIVAYPMILKRTKTQVLYVARAYQFPDS